MGLVKIQKTNALITGDTTKTCYQLMLNKNYNVLYNIDYTNPLNTMAKIATFKVNATGNYYIRLNGSKTYTGVIVSVVINGVFNHIMNITSSTDTNYDSRIILNVKPTDVVTLYAGVQGNMGSTNSYLRIVSLNILADLSAPTITKITMNGTSS